MASYNTTIEYLRGYAESTTSKVGSITNNGVGITYTYGVNGNINTITQNGQIIKYYYNELNEVTREDNQVLNKTITNTYDAGGNITNKTEYPYTTGTPAGATKTYPYTYGDTNWKDKLTSYNGNAITYDSIGNPLTYNGNTYTWEEGRQLASASGNGNAISYKYNDAGIRTQKIVNGVTTNYHLVGNKVTYEDNGTDKIYYTYDASSKLVSMSLNGVEYYYIRNAQGDIIGLFDKTGAQVVSYTYDMWGKLISTTGTLASTVGVKNPYRYRGYRYDSETGLYYLQSRYYNADWGRFINADGVIGKTGEILGHNMFAYCQNNCVNAYDPSGFQMLAEDGGGGYNTASGKLSFSYKNSIIKGAGSGMADSAGGYLASKALKEKIVEKSYGTLALSEFTSSLGKGAKFKKKALGLVGSIGFTAWDAGNSIIKGEYAGAVIDILSGAAGFGAGFLVGLITATAVTAGAPVLLMGALGFIIVGGAGMYIDKVSSGAKNKYYRR